MVREGREGKVHGQVGFASLPSSKSSPRQAGNHDGSLAP